MLFIKTLIFSLIGPGSVTVLIPYLLLLSSLNFAFETGRFRLLGLAAIVLGGLIYFWCAWDFALLGRGTPAPWDPPQRLVSRRLYRKVRNPIFIGITLVLAGEAIVFQSGALLTYAALVWTGFHLRVVYFEEPTLRRKFGAVYEEYCKTVPRWIPASKHWIGTRAHAGRH
jgi:protein-S-isoprenylcysteine O-methyltransferase Ste14